MLLVAKDSAVYIISSLLVRLFGFITIPIYTRWFSVPEYGVISVITACTGLLGLFFGMGLLEGTNRHFLDSTDENRRSCIVSSGFWPLLIWVLAAFCSISYLVPLVSEYCFSSDAYNEVFCLAVAGAAVSALLVFLMNILRMTFRADLFAGLKIFHGAVSLILSLLFVIHYDMGLWGLFLGGVIGTAATTLLTLCLTRSYLRFSVSPGVLKDILLFGAPLVPAGLAYWIFQLSDQIILARISGREQVGFYAIAIKIILPMELLRQAMAQAWIPRALAIYRDDRDSPVVFGKFLLLNLVGFSFPAVSCSLFAKEIVYCFAGQKFSPSWVGVGPLAIAGFAYASTQSTALGISLKKKTFYVLVYAWVAALCNIILNIVLIPPLGMFGAAVATMISYCLLTLLYLATSQRLFPIRIEYGKIVRLLFAMCFYIVLSYVLSIRLSFSAILLKTLACLLYLPLLYAIGLVDKTVLKKVFDFLLSTVGLGRFLARQGKFSG